MPSSLADWAAYLDLKFELDTELDLSLNHPREICSPIPGSSPTLPPELSGEPFPEPLKPHLSELLASLQQPSTLKWVRLLARWGPGKVYKPQRSGSSFRRPIHLASYHPILKNKLNKNLMLELQNLAESDLEEFDHFLARFRWPPLCDVQWLHSARVQQVANYYTFSV